MNIYNASVKLWTCQKGMKLCVPERVNIFLPAPHVESVTIHSQTNWKSVICQSVKPFNVNTNLCQYQNENLLSGPGTHVFYLNKNILLLKGPIGPCVITLKSKTFDIIMWHSWVPGWVRYNNLPVPLYYHYLSEFVVFNYVWVFHTFILDQVPVFHSEMKIFVDKNINEFVYLVTE